MQAGHEHFMDRAIALAQRSLDEGNGPAGCVITQDGKIIAEGRNLVNTNLDPTAHGEMLAIRNAASKRGTTILSGLTLYTSIEPCPMCCWAIINAKIPTLVLGARHARFNRSNLGTYAVEALIAMTGGQLSIITGVRERECEDLQYAALESRVRELRQQQHANGDNEGGLGKQPALRGLRGPIVAVVNSLAALLQRIRRP